MVSFNIVFGISLIVHESKKHKIYQILYSFRVSFFLLREWEEARHICNGGERGPLQFQPPTHIPLANTFFRLSTPFKVLLDIFQSRLISVHWWDEGGWENQPPVRIPPATRSNLHQACPVESAIPVSPFFEQTSYIQ